MAIKSNFPGAINQRFLMLDILNIRIMKIEIASQLKGQGQTDGELNLVNLTFKQTVL